MRLQAIFGEHDPRRAEAGGLDEVGSRLKKPGVHFPDQIGAGSNDVLVAPLQARTAIVGGRELMAQDEGAEGAVEHQNALGEQLLEQFYAVCICSH